MDENTETSLKLLTRAIKIQNIELLKKNFTGNRCP